MAQRTIHYLFGEKIAEQVTLTDRKRFLLGSILPDAMDADDRDTSHFKVRTDTHVYLDFEAFRERYDELIRKDDLYFGYYMHLVEDAFYRVFIYQDRFTMPRTREEIALLHNDYHILNSYIIQKYAPRNILAADHFPEQEVIGGIGTFSVRESLYKLSAEFAEQTQGTTVFLTEQMVDEFVQTYLSPIIDEAKQVKRGTSALRGGDYTWRRRR